MAGVGPSAMGAASSETLASAATIFFIWTSF